VAGPAKIGHVGSQNLTTFQTFITHNFLLQYGMATQFSEIVHNLTGFPSYLTEPKYYISVLRCISSNHMVYFSPHALFLQARSQFYLPYCNVITTTTILIVPTYCMYTLFIGVAQGGGLGG